jgi:hypothetical protein
MIQNNFCASLTNNYVEMYYITFNNFYFIADSRGKMKKGKTSKEVFYVEKIIEHKGEGSKKL